MEAFCMGFNACRDGLRHDDGEAFIAGLTAAWERTGGEQARRVFAALTDPDAALAALPEEDRTFYPEAVFAALKAERDRLYAENVDLRARIAAARPRLPDGHRARVILDGEMTEPHPDECRCQDDKGNVNFDPACPFHGDNGTMIARWPNRKDPYA
jgi:hypothetical protein